MTPNPRRAKKRKQDEWKEALGNTTLDEVVRVCYILGVEPVFKLVPRKPKPKGRKGAK